MRDIRRPSASAIERSLACELSAVLPKAPEAPREHNSPSKRGDRVHKALERYSLGARWTDVEHVVLPWDCGNLKEVAEAMPKLEPIEGIAYAEAECWYNPLTGAAMPGVSATPVAPGFWRGQADLLGWYEHSTMGRMVCVLDVKSGNPRFQIDGGAAQLGYFALWLRAMTKEPLVASIAYLTQDWTKPRVHVWSDKSLDAFAGKLRSHEERLQLLEANDVMPPPVKNKGCIFCSVKPVCPAWKVVENDETI